MDQIRLQNQAKAANIQARWSKSAHFFVLELSQINEQTGAHTVKKTVGTKQIPSGIKHMIQTYSIQITSFLRVVRLLVEKI